MFQFSYKLEIVERIKARCERHPRYNPERDGRGRHQGRMLDLLLSMTSIRQDFTGLRAPRVSQER